MKEKEWDRGSAQVFREKEKEREIYRERKKISTSPPVPVIFYKINVSVLREYLIYKKVSNVHNTR